MDVSIYEITFLMVACIATWKLPDLIRAFKSDGEAE